MNLARVDRGSAKPVIALVALTLAAFSYVTTESLPIGLLPLIADDLNQSSSSVGMLVTAYGLTVVVTAVPLTLLTKRIPRRRLLAFLLSVFVVSTAVSAWTSNYWVLLSARVATASTHAVFWSIVAAAAVGLFAPEIRGRVTGALYGGISLAPVIGVPAGTWLGEQAGWQVAFLALSGLGLVTFVAVVALLPTTPPEESHAASGAEPDTRRFWTLITATGLVITGAFTAYTYISVFVIDVSGFGEASISVLLLVFGIAGIAGTAVTSAIIDRWPRRAMIVPVTLLAADLVALYALGHVKFAAVGLLAVWGFALTSLPAALQSRVLQVAPGNSDIASAVYVATFNLGIAAGAFIGGLVLPGPGVRAVMLTGGILAAAAAAVLIAEPAIATFRRRSPTPTRVGTDG